VPSTELSTDRIEVVMMPASCNKVNLLLIHKRIS